MGEQLLMSVDIGTTSTKCLVINKYGNVKAHSSRDYPIINKKENWLEQDPDGWWKAVCNTIKECLKTIPAESISGISLSGQMSAPVLIDNDGKPVCSSILIADTRSHRQSQFLHENYYDDIVEKTGNKPIDAFTLSKLLWIMENKKETIKKSRYIMFPKDYVRYKLTNKIGTDPTDAGNSLLYDSEIKDWDWCFIKKLNIPTHLFPEVFDSCELFGYVSKQAACKTGLKLGTPVITGAADMACSQIGSGANIDGVLAVTLSTSGQIVINTPSIHEYGVGKVTFHNSVLSETIYTMGTLFVGGLGVDWGYKLLYNVKYMSELDYENLNRLTVEMNNYSPGSDGLMFLPFLVGSATPYFDPSDRGSWIGLQLNQKKSLMLHSILEGIAFNIKESVEVIQKMGISIDIVHIGAGGSRNEVWCQIIADMLGVDIIQLENHDCSALGAAIIAGVGVGIYESVSEAVQLTVRGKKKFKSDNNNNKVYETLFASYKQMYELTNNYYRVQKQE